MNTKLLMISSAAVMSVSGIVLSFMPQEVLLYFGADHSTIHPLKLQLIGALYFSFAMMNWMAKANLIGGIYGRPLAIGNVTHFVMGALTLSKYYISSHTDVILVPCIVYVVFGIWFAVVSFTHPLKKES